MLNVLAEAEDLADGAKLLLDGVPGGHLVGAAVGAEQVPRVEARKVLQQAEELVLADGGGGEAQVVRHGGVVDEGVGDHGGGFADVCVMKVFREMPEVKVTGCTRETAKLRGCCWSEKMTTRYRDVCVCVCV